MDPKFIRDISLAYAAVYDQELRQELSEAEFKWDPNKNIIAAKDGKLGIMTKGDSKSWRQPSEQEKGEIPISSTNKFKNSPAGQKFMQKRDAAKLASTASVGSGNGIKPLPNAPKPTSGYGIRQGITAAPAKPGTSTGGFSSGVRPATSTEPTKPAPGSTTSKPITSQPFVSKSQSSAAEIRGMIGRSMERQAAPTPAATPRTDIRNRDVRARGGFDPRFDRRPKSITTSTTAATVKQEDYEYDAFDIILEYLIAEGYADTNKNALVIMANMSEEWRHSICENFGAAYSVLAPKPVADGTLDAARRKGLVKSPVVGGAMSRKPVTQSAAATAGPKGPVGGAMSRKPVTQSAGGRAIS